LTLGALLVAGDVLSAQGARSVVIGRIVDSLTNLPAANVAVVLKPSNAQIVTDAQGFFEITASNALDSLLEIRHVGYRSIQLSIDAIRSRSRLDLGVVALSALPTVLDEIGVEAEEVRRYPHLADFYQRRRNGASGFFLTRSEIARRRAGRTSDLLRQTPLVKQPCVDTDWQKPAMIPGKATRVAGRCVDYCPIQVYLDGRHTDLKLDDIGVSSIAALEVYSGPGTPAIFGDGRCGSVGIWSIQNER
jgi:hypothetical protein